MKTLPRLLLAVFALAAAGLLRADEAKSKDTCCDKDKGCCCKDGCSEKDKGAKEEKPAAAKPADKK